MSSTQSRVLVVFESQRGQSRKIAEYVAELARCSGYAGRAIHVSLAPRLALASYDAAVIVAPVHYGGHPRTVRGFLRHHAGVLGNMPIAFVSVSNSAVSADPAVRAEAARLARRFVEEAGVKPALVVTAGGALAYPSYNPLLRWVMRRIAASTGAPTETAYTHELTVWSEIDAAMNPFLHALPRRGGDIIETAPPSGVASAMRMADAH